MNELKGNEKPVDFVQLVSGQKGKSFTTSQCTFYLVLEGAVELNLEVKCEMNTVKMATGDVFWVHRAANGRGSLRTRGCILAVSFNSGLVSRYVPAYPFSFQVDSVNDPEKDYQPLCRILIQMSSSFYSADQERFTQLSLFFSLIQEMDRQFTVMEDEQVILAGNYNERIRAIASYVNQNYNQDITQADMASYLYLTPQHCSRFFRRHFQMTFLEYLNYVRLQHALDQMRDTDLTITQIAFQNGFPNLNSFNRVFRQYKQMLPSEYRRQYAETVRTENTKAHDKDIATDKKAVIAAARSVEHLKTLKYYEEVLRLCASHKTEEKVAERLKLNTTNKGKPAAIPEAILNIGQVSDCLMHQLHVQLAEIQALLHYKYIRFHGILDSTLISQIPGTDRYNFQNVDLILDYFLELNLIPFIEIGHKPPKQSFALSPLEGLMETQTDQHYTGHLERLEPLIKHCIHRYGRQTVQSWYFEIWMDFDQYFNNPQPGQALSRYIDHYGRCWQAIHTLLPEAHIGGPGFNTVASFHIFEAFLTQMSKKKIPLDFLSAYLYPYESSHQADQANDTVITGSEAVITQRIKQLHNIIKRSAYHKQKLFITEYGFSVSPRNYINDTCLPAAFIIKTILETEVPIQAFGYFRALDLSSNYTDVIAPLYGGPGLITKDKIKKPAYYAASFLNQTTGHLLAKGKGYLFTQSNDTTWRLLLYNYSHPGPDYLLQVRNHTLKIAENNQSQGADEKEINITIAPITENNYLIRHSYVNKHHGSVFDEWISLNAQPHLSKEDLAYLNHISIPHQRMYSIEAKENQLSFTVKMLPNEIRAIDITSISEGEGYGSGGRF